jgi:hypothetical protein
MVPPPYNFSPNIDAPVQPFEQVVEVETTSKPIDWYQSIVARTSGTWIIGRTLCVVMVQ